MTDLSKVLIQTTGVHVHRREEDNGLSSPVKKKFLEMHSPNSGTTARQMQRALQVFLFLCKRYNEGILLGIS